MNIRKNLELFQELIRCGHELYLWSYSPGMDLIHTNCPDTEQSGDYIFMDDLVDHILEYSKTSRHPLVISTFLNLMWVAAFERNQGRLKSIQILGPMFSGANSQQKIREMLDKRQWSVHSKINVLKGLEKIPIIPSNLLWQYTFMLHYCVTGERITSKDLQYMTFPSKEEKPDGESIDKISDEHLGIWASEQEFLNLVRAGSADYRTALDKSSLLSSGIKATANDSLEMAKYNMVVLLTLVSRAAIEGGLSPAVSYNLQDYYSQRIIDAGSVSETSILCNTMLEDYVTRIQQAHNNMDISKTVQSCCDYVTTHITERFTIDFLAARAGYTEYYFSRKFKQEMGMSISEYIKQEKVKKAALMLSTTTMSIQDVSNELAFSSRSYFSDVFQKIMGESPGEYRKTHLKI